MPFFGLIVGIMLGLVVGAVSDLSTVAATAGGIVGWLAGLLYGYRRRLEEAEGRLIVLEAALAGTPAAAQPQPVRPAAAAPAPQPDAARGAAKPEPRASVQTRPAARRYVRNLAAEKRLARFRVRPAAEPLATMPTTAPAATPAPQNLAPWGVPSTLEPAPAAPAASEEVHQPFTPAPPATPGLVQQTFAAARAWLFGGNTIVRMGIVLVFLGLAFLLRYASERVVVPVELRYLGVAATALVALAIGWRLRERRRAYALLMQGAAVAVMYLTIFAAMKLPDVPLIPTALGFGLLVGVAALSALLAVLQDARSLAVAGSLGGFAAPVLASTGGGSHIALFSYFALLNTGILGIAWFKAWRALNLVGFFGTFLIGLGWAIRSYSAADYVSAQGFLILFFLMFVGIGLLFARRVLLDDPDVPPTADTAAWRAWIERSGHRAQRYVDATLLFGVPLVGFGMQYGLMRGTEHGAAFSALALGAFYLLLARLVFARNPVACRLLAEVFLALGVVFASLAIPLGLDATWTSAAWAVEAAGIYWIGHRQQRPIARAFAVLLQLGAAWKFMSAVNLLPPGDTLIQGPVLGAAMLGLALLSNMLVHRLHVRSGESDARRGWDAGMRPVFSTLGLWFLYLIAPLMTDSDGTAAAWAIAALVTVAVGLKLNEKTWLGNAMLLQLCAGGVFLLGIDRAPDGMASGVLAAGSSGLKGLFIAALLGVGSLVTIAMTIRAARARNDEALARRMAWSMLFGLSFLVLAVLFVLPWAKATAVWAVCGVILLWLSIRLSLMPAFIFALLLEGVAGAAFLADGFGHLAGGMPPASQLAAFAHAGFWTPAIIALAAFAMAWRLHGWVSSDGLDDADSEASTTENAGPADTVLPLLGLVWSAAWWAFAWGVELARVLPHAVLSHSFLAVMSISVLLALWVACGPAKRPAWPQLIGLCAGLLPLAAGVVLLDYAGNKQPFGNWGAAAWLVCAPAVLALLRSAAGRLTLSKERACHLAAAWLLLMLAAFEMRHFFMQLSSEESTWRWLGWSLPLILWLLWSEGRRTPRLWPVTVFPDIYQRVATLPVCLILLAWLATSTVLSDGNAFPLPYYIPVLNPLEIAQVLVLFASWQWLRRLHEDSTTANGLAPMLARLVQAGAFLVYTCAVLRAVHHLSGVDYQLDALLASMLVQASLSIAWSLLALGLMISGHRRHRRAIWITGAILIAVVVAKLFLVELSNQGGLERIVSFIGVGVLLLVVGYFAPLPPRAADRTPAH